MCIKDEDVEIIGINSTMTKGGQRFTLSHELYHLLIEKKHGQTNYLQQPLQR